MKLKTGDWVRWVSKVGASEIEIKRKGKIIYTIDPFARLCEIINSEEFKESVRKKFNIIYNKIDEFRPYTSYLILIKDDGSIQNIYWPDVNILKKIRKRKSKRKIKIKNR